MESTATYPWSKRGSKLEETAVVWPDQRWALPGLLDKTRYAWMNREGLSIHMHGENLSGAQPYSFTGLIMIIIQMRMTYISIGYTYNGHLNDEYFSKLLSEIHFCASRNKTAIPSSKQSRSGRYLVRENNFSIFSSFKSHHFPTITHPKEWKSENTFPTLPRLLLS